MSSKRVRIMSLSVITAVILAGCGAQSQQQSSTPNPPSSSSSGSASPASQPSSSGSPSQSPSTASSQSRQPSAPGQPSSSRSSSSSSSSSSSPSTSSSTGQSGGQPSVSVSTNGVELPGTDVFSEGTAPTAGSASETSNSGESGFPGENDNFPEDQAPSAGNGPESDEIDFSEETSGGGNSSGEENTPGGTVGTGGSGRSAAEEVAAKEAIFQGSVSDYDGFILKEREYIANRRNQAGSEDDLEDYEGPLFEEAGGPGGSSQAEQEGPGSAYETSSSGGGYRPEGPGDNRQGDFENTRVSAPPPADIPSGDDDDVVARQIREAAEKETDPQLREALWEEYRKYKNQKK